MTLPAFTGCRNGADDLSPVLTGMISGPDNHLLVHQDGPLTDYPPPGSPNGKARAAGLPVLPAGLR